MADQYHIGLEAFSLDRLRRHLESGDLLPGRRILGENVAENFEKLEALGIRNLKDLTAALRTKDKIKAFSEKSGLPQDYLMILRREANSYQPKLVYLREIRGVNPEYVKSLEAAGIKNTKQLFERARTAKDRAELSEATDIPVKDVLELTKLSDLARIGGLGAAYLRLFYETGADTIQGLSQWDPQTLSERLHAVNKQRRLTKIVPSLKDVTNYIEKAKELPKVIEYD